MPNYRRANLPGATYFFTIALRDRRSGVLVKHVDDLRAAFSMVRRLRPFEPLATVVLPDHLHCIWTLPEGDADNASRWRHIKTLFTRRLDPPRPSGIHLRPGERGVWQRRFWERLILGERDLQAHVDYIHHNPVKHGYVVKACDWPHSSLHRYVARGDLARNWSAPS